MIVFHIIKAENITIHPTIYGINASFTFALSSAVDSINLTPKYTPIATAKKIPIDNRRLYNVDDASFNVFPSIVCLFPALTNSFASLIISSGVWEAEVPTAPA